jgi:hypothetical protein
MSIRFSIQDGIWLVLAVALAFGWWWQWRDNQAMQKSFDEAMQWEMHCYANVLNQMSHDIHSLVEENEARKNQPIDNAPGSSGKP